MTMGRPSTSTNPIRSTRVRKGWLPVVVGLLALCLAACQALGRGSGEVAYSSVAAEPQASAADTELEIRVQEGFDGPDLDTGLRVSVSEHGGAGAQAQPLPVAAVQLSEAELLRALDALPVLAVNADAAAGNPVADGATRAAGPYRGAPVRVSARGGGRTAFAGCRVAVGPAVCPRGRYGPRPQRVADLLPPNGSDFEPGGGGGPGPPG